MKVNNTYPLTHLSRGLATSFLQEVDKRNIRISIRLEKLNKLLKGKIDNAYFERAERIFARLPTCLLGRGSNRRLLFVHLSRTRLNKIKAWQEDGFCIHRGKIMFSEASPMMDVCRPSIVFSKHAIQRIFERAPERYLSTDDRLDVKKIYDFIHEILIWQQIVYSLQIDVLTINKDKIADSEDFFLGFFNLSFLVPAPSGAFLCEFFATTLYVRTYIGEDMFSAPQSRIVKQLRSIPEGFKTKRIAFHESLNDSAPSGNFLHEKMQVAMMVKFFAGVIADNFDVFCRKGSMDDQVEMRLLIENLVGGENPKTKNRELLTSFEGMDARTFFKYANRARS